MTTRLTTPEVAAQRERYEAFINHVPMDRLALGYIKRMRADANEHMPQDRRYAYITRVLALVKVGRSYMDPRKQRMYGDMLEWEISLYMFNNLPRLTEMIKKGGRK